jgi:hypothetical protein
MAKKSTKPVHVTSEQAHSCTDESHIIRNAVKHFREQLTVIQPAQEFPAATKQEGSSECLYITSTE